MAKKLDVIGTLEQGFRMVIDEPRFMLFFLVPVIMLLGVFALFGVTFFYSFGAAGATPALLDDPLMGLYMSAYLIALSLVALVCMAGCIIKADASLKGKKMPVAEAFLGGIRAFPRLLVSLIIVSVIGGLGFIALLIPGIYLMVRLMLAMPACVLEGKGLGIKSSWEISKGNWWRLFALTIIIALISSLLSFLIPVVGMVISYLFVSPASAICYAIAYRKLK